MANTEAGEGSSFDIQSVSRVGQILGLFGPLTSELSAAEAAERLGLNRTTAYRYCASLVTAGILERGQQRGTFVLGGLMLQLGIQALARNRVVDVAPAYLKDLAATAGTTAVLSLWGARGPVVALVQEDTTNTVVVTVRPGTQLEMNSSQIRVFLAHHSDQKMVERMLAQLPDAERAELEAAVYTVRRTGYSVAKLPGGLFGVAAPVFDENGLTASIALLGAEQMTDLSAGSPLISALTTTAAALSDELGGREGAHSAHQNDNLR